MEEYKLALQKWGMKAQKIKAIEELNELSVQLAKDVNNLPTKDIEGEIADAHIMLAQMKLLYPGWYKAYEKKMERLEVILYEDQPQIESKDYPMCHCHNNNIPAHHAVAKCEACDGVRLT